MKNKSHHFLYVPVLFSIVAVMLIFSPVMASEEKPAYAGCPYLQQYHRVLEWHQQYYKQQNLMMVSAKSDQQVSTEQHKTGNIVQF